MTKIRLLVTAFGAVAILTGCELEKPGPNSAPPPPPPPPMDVVSNKPATPTADRLVFSSGADEPDLEVYTTFRDGSGRTRLTRNLSGDSGAVAYPNTGLVYYVCGRAESICVTNTAGTANDAVMSTQRIGFPLIEDPAISPDGSRMIFTGIHISQDGSKTNYDLYLYDFNTQEITNLAVGASQDQMGAWITNDVIVWSRLRSGDYDLVSFDLGAARGSAPTPLTNNDLDDLGVDANSDGSALSYISIKGNEGDVKAIPFDSGTSQTPITVAPVTLERGFIGGDPDTAWSPNGNSIAFAGFDGQDVEIYTVDWLGGTPMNVTDNNVYDVDPEWAQLPPSFSVLKPASLNESLAATDRMRFEIILDAPQDETLTVDYATVGGTATPGTDFTPISGTATFAPGQTSVIVEVSIANDLLIEPLEKLSLRLSNSSAGTLIGLEEVDGSIIDDEVEPTPTPTVSPTPSPSPSPTASPTPTSDGRIVFTSTRGGPQQVYTMESNGTDVDHISGDQGSSTLSAPAWLHDGSRVIHTALNTGTNPPQPEVMDRPADGTGSFRMLVLHPSTDTDPEYRPGMAEAFVWASDRDGDFEIYYSTPGSGTITKLTDNTTEDGAPTFSGDGRYVTYHSDADGDFDIYRLEVGTDGDAIGTPTNLTDEAPGQPASDELHPDHAWTQNKIVYHGNKHGDFDIFVMDVSTGQEIHVTHETTDEYLATFSPSGSKIAFVRNVAGNLEIFVAAPTGAASSVNITNDPGSDSSPDWGPGI